jgi:hypothetical protein
MQLARPSTAPDLKSYLKSGESEKRKAVMTPRLSKKDWALHKPAVPTKAEWSPPVRTAPVFVLTMQQPTRSVDFIKENAIVPPPPPSRSADSEKKVIHAEPAVKENNVGNVELNECFGRVPDYLIKRNEELRHERVRRCVNALTFVYFTD